MDDLISRFRDYQIEWLTAHNDIEFCDEEENLIIGFLKDTAESFMRENQSAQQWIPYSERLPNYDEEVLVDYHGKIRLASLTKNDEEYPWYFIVNRFNAKLETVRAWLPLPEPYKEEN